MTELFVDRLPFKDMLNIVEATDAKQYTFVFLSPEQAGRKANNWRSQIDIKGLGRVYNISKHASAVTVRRWVR